MAQFKIRDLAAAAGANTDQILEVTNDPSGAPASQKLSILQIQTLFDARFQAILAEGAFVDGDKTKLDNLEIGVTVQGYDVELEALSSVTSAADALPYFTGSGTATTTTLTSFARSILDDDNAATARATLGAGTGDGDVTKVGTPANNQIGVWTGDGTIEGDANLTFDTTTDILSIPNIRATNLNTGDNIIVTDTDGDLTESGVTVESAPAGGSGFAVVEYASAPSTPPSGFLWIEAVDATTKSLNYYNGIDTFSVDLSS